MPLLVTHVILFILVTEGKNSWTDRMDEYK